jgi:hypothetical protein
MPSPSIIQANQDSQTASSSTLAVPFLSNLSAHSALYIVMCQIVSSANVMTCSDSAGNSLVQLGPQLAVGSGAAISHFATSALVAGGADTVNFGFSPSCIFRAGLVVEIGNTSGLDLAAPGGLYHSENLNTTGTAMTSGTLSPSVANGLAIGAFLDGNLSSNTNVPGAGFTDLVTSFLASVFWQFTSGANHGDVAYQNYASTANVPILFTTSGFENIGGCVGALFAPPAAGPVVPNFYHRKNSLYFI